MDFEDLPKLARAVKELIDVVRENKSKTSPGGSKVTKSELFSLIRAIGALIVAVADSLES